MYLLPKENLEEMLLIFCVTFDTLLYFMITIIIINNELFVIIFTKVEKIKVIFIEKKHNFIYNDIGTREGDNCVL